MANVEGGPSCAQHQHFKDFSLPETVLPSVLTASDGNGSQDVEITGAEGMPTSPTRVANMSREGPVASQEIDMANHLTDSASLSACMEFYYKITDEAQTEDMFRCCKHAWRESDLMTMKLIFHLRDIRRGKGAKLPFLDCLVWLVKHHHRTLVANLRHVATVGCWKDLLDLVVRLLVGEQSYPVLTNRNEKKVKKMARRTDTEAVQRQARLHGKRAFRNCDVGLGTQQGRAAKGCVARDMQQETDVAKLRLDGGQAGRRGKRARLIAGARNGFLHDEPYRAIHVEVARLFAVAMQADLAASKMQQRISFAAKWAPSLEGHHDQHSLIASTIAQILFPRGAHAREGQSYESYICRARDLYRKEYLVPLRRYLEVPETMMSAREWHSIDYDHVPSMCIKMNSKSFQSHDRERFEKYLSSKVHAVSSAPKPHDLVVETMKYLNWEDADARLATTETQWISWLNRMKRSGSLRHALAVCDTSGSMTWGESCPVPPIAVALALSLAIAEQAAPPFENIMCTFDTAPHFLLVQHVSLRCRVDHVLKMAPAPCTSKAMDLEAVLTTLLDRSKSCNSRPEDMIKTLFVFSDVDFDAAVGDAYAAKHVQVKQQFQLAGYDVPTIVYWNISARRDKAFAPVFRDDCGAILLSGFCGPLLRLFLGPEHIEFTPSGLMMHALQDYNYLVILD
eukprot:evm.model.scf_269EXC.8 EVM.evm.TU.scf_269EXC.8   scf_269EXC:104886-107240(+)